MFNCFARKLGFNNTVLTEVYRSNNVPEIRNSKKRIALCFPHFKILKASGLNLQPSLSTVKYFGYGSVDGVCLTSMSNVAVFNLKMTNCFYSFARFGHF